MMSPKIVLSIAVVFVMLIYSGEALQCFECEGEPDGDCANAVVASMNFVECPGGWQAMCRHTDKRSGDTRRVSRGCTKWANPDLCTLLYRSAARNPIALNVFSCNTCWDPLCNINTTKK